MSVIVFCFGVGFFGPLGEVEFAAVVFAFDDYLCAVTVADVGDVAAIFRAGFDAAVYAVVEVVAEEICDLSFKFGSGLFGAVSVSAQNGGSFGFWRVGLSFWGDCPRLGCLSVCGAAGPCFGAVSGWWLQRHALPSL